MPVLALRSAVHALIEQAQTGRALRASTDARVVLSLVPGTNDNHEPPERLLETLEMLLLGHSSGPPQNPRRTPAATLGDLSELLQVSQVETLDSSFAAGATNTDDDGFVYAVECSLATTTEPLPWEIAIELRPARGLKCPRCWMYRPEVLAPRDIGSTSILPSVGGESYEGLCDRCRAVVCA